MKDSDKKPKLTSYDDLFLSSEERIEVDLEKIKEIPLNELKPFKNHPFKVIDDEAMQETAASIRKYGVLVPAIARLQADGS